MNIPESVKDILAVLNTAGFEAYAVGGCVRDSVLGREPEDWDITTNAAPQEVKKLFRRTVDTGIAHGTVTVLRGGEGFEVTTYRLDGSYSDGRHPDSVTFTPELCEDLRRRDFTINAMACAADGEIVDLFGGREDLRRGLIRCVGNADERFREDALRILRALRFAAQLDFRIEEGSWEALKRHAPNLIHVSKERILTELNKLLLSPHPERISLIYEAKLSAYLVESFPRLCCAPWAAELPEKKHLRWAAAAKELDATELRELLRELKSDLDTLDCASLLLQKWKKPLPDTAAGVRVLLSEIGAERFDELLLLKQHDAADAAARAAELKAAVMAAGDCISLKTLAVSGRDLIQAGVQPGPVLGQKLKELFQSVLERPELNQREILLEMLEK